MAEGEGKFKVGDKFPKVNLFENTPGGVVDTEELCAGKRVVIFGMLCLFPSTYCD
jgi:peroxiredoxin